MKKYLIFDSGDFIETSEYSEYKKYIDSHPGSHGKRVNNKKEEESYRKYCQENPNFNKKVYVAIFDNEVKRFDEWQECKDFIGQNKDVKYKSFFNEEDAQAFINANVYGRYSNDYPICRISEACSMKLCNAEEDLFEIVKNETVLYRYKNEAIAKQFSIERELSSVLKAIEWCINYNEECVIIEYRNIGTEMWANKTWKANKDFSINYQKKIEKLRQKINIEFRKIK